MNIKNIINWIFILSINICLSPIFVVYLLGTLAAYAELDLYYGKHGYYTIDPCGDKTCYQCIDMYFY